MPPIELMGKFDLSPDSWDLSQNKAEFSRTSASGALYVHVGEDRERTVNSNILVPCGDALWKRIAICSLGILPCRQV